MLALVLTIGLSAGCSATQDIYGGGTSSEASETSGIGGTTTNSSSADQRYPDILKAELQREGGNTYTLSVTVSSPYDSPQRYADAWRVLAPDGTVLGERELMHDHASEQPFTRAQTGLRIPEGTKKVTVEGRDLENGYGGETVTIPVPGG